MKFHKKVALLLSNLLISNYALIDQLDVGFDSGMTTITGETGAGKSILLGALSLVLGKRADLKVLKNTQHKCVIEATFQIGHLGLAPFFETEDLDYAPDTILRREINPNGKSRAFINDTPVNLQVLEKISGFLIDVHTQYETQNIIQESYVFGVIDALAGNESLLKNFRDTLASYTAAVREKDELLARQQQSAQDHEYKQFIYDELLAAQLTPGMQEPLEEKVSSLSQVDDIRELASDALQLLSIEEHGLVDQLLRLRSLMQQLTQKSILWQESSDQVQALSSELEDLYRTLEQLFENVESDPQALQEAEDRLQLLYQLQKKHQKNSVEDLIELQAQLEQELQLTANFDQHLTQLDQQIQELETLLRQQTELLHQARLKIIPDFEQQIHQLLTWMGMENARFNVSLENTNSFGTYGLDRADFLFSANAGSRFLPLKQVASGGERSRIMLAIKSILAKHQQLPTLIFDEIDTGVSGNISDRMGHIMSEMSTHMQLFAITHLPQVAAKGQQHFKVYKESYDGQTRTRIKELNSEQRIQEIAQMLSGKAITEAAIEQAKELLS
ncbi:MAG: DNA repair protein RecN [Flavobacteriaceae bacterium]